MQSIAMRKVTISLPLDLVEFADRAAQQAEISRSQVISQALSEAKARVERRLAEEGYRFYAGESVEFATASALAVAEAAATYQAGENDDASEAW
jgi:metal-responsive CopG/Arc/MetJ family transcriptional regulator